MRRLYLCKIASLGAETPVFRLDAGACGGLPERLGEHSDKLPRLDILEVVMGRQEQQLSPCVIRLAEPIQSLGRDDRLLMVEMTEFLNGREARCFPVCGNSAAMAEFFRSR